ncbi:hypothetical protein C0J52_14811 [Blattella germanica]|nr:hypothetical protein C0J52_14811 [Blattella germanica]
MVINQVSSLDMFSSDCNRCLKDRRCSITEKLRRLSKELLLSTFGKRQCLRLKSI